MRPNINLGFPEVHSDTDLVAQSEFKFQDQWQLEIQAKNLTQLQTLADA